VSAEAHASFACFGGTATIHVRGVTRASGELAAARGRIRLLEAHHRLSRFNPGSELSRLNGDPRVEVPASALLRNLAAAVRTAGESSGGLVDATILPGIERTGYRRSLVGVEPVPLSAVLASHIGRAPARPDPRRLWRQIEVSDATEAIRRPPGIGIDGGGIAKGMLADQLAADLGDFPAFAVDCCGDIRLGGTASRERTVLVDDPFGGSPIHEVRISAGAVATSGIGRRCWIDPDGNPAHHILDPSTGRPAFTGLVQATAFAPTALLAETYAKAALLSGPEGAAVRLPHGGVLVDEMGAVEVVAGDRPLEPEPLAA
jgi:FAD:protein FMN transferase